MPAKTLPLSLLTRFHVGSRRSLDLGVQRPAVAADGEDGCALRQLVLHDDNGQILLLRDLECGHDVGERLLARRGLDLQDPGEVLLLDVDDDECSAGGGQGSPSRWWTAACSTAARP